MEIPDHVPWHGIESVAGHVPGGQPFTADFSEPELQESAFQIRHVSGAVEDTDPAMAEGIEMFGEDAHGDFVPPLEEDGSGLVSILIFSQSDHGFFHFANLATHEEFECSGAVGIGQSCQKSEVFPYRVTG